MKKQMILLVIFIMAMAIVAHAVDVTVAWDAADNATGYKIYVSFDNGITWDGGTDAGNVTQYTMPNMPEDTLVMFQVGAYNSVSETITTWQGAWYDHRRRPAGSAVGLGVK